MKTTKGYLFIIDTDSYSGNFERDICAYITGHIGDCGVGDDFIQDNLEYDQFEGLVDTGYFSHGCARPVKIWSSPRYLNDGLGSSYLPGEELEAFEKYKAKADKEVSEYVEKMIEETTYEDFCKRKIPFYNSVAIAFYERPSHELIELMKGRAYQFPDERYIKYNEKYNFPGERIKIEGFRLIEVIEKYNEESV